MTVKEKALDIYDNFANTGNPPLTSYPKECAIKSVEGIIRALRAVHPMTTKAGKFEEWNQYGYYQLVIKELEKL